jgi:hypothetical protein
MRIVAAIVSAVVLSLPASAAADGDGYFCVARGYLACETRFAATPSKHELHVVRFSTAGGIVAAQPITLDDFQVHGIRCLSTVVELAGWETTYSVDISVSGGVEHHTVSRLIQPGGGESARARDHRLTPAFRGRVSRNGRLNASTQVRHRLQSAAPSGIARYHTVWIEPCLLRSGAGRAAG